MNSTKNDLIIKVASYYSKKLAEHGETPQGVDWNGEESQLLRFEQLCKIFSSAEGGISINDLGCGYGALLEYLDSRYSISAYLGVDVSVDMVKSASLRYQSVANARFITANEPDIESDFGIASGIFNVNLGRNKEEWFDYLVKTLDALNRTSRKGFSFNCLTSYSDEHKKQNHLYYADPARLFDLCKKKYSRNVALLHDYGLYEFTILVRKTIR